MAPQPDGQAGADPGRHALVIGCGIAGMASAEVLSKYFEQVTIVERDPLPTEPSFRPGKPQGRHLHILLQRGQRHLEAIFPGLVAELKLHGVREWETGCDPRWYHFGGWRKRHPGMMKTVLPSMPLLEYVLRTRVQKNPRIRIMTECTVDELIANDHRVLGVRLQHHRAGRGRQSVELRGMLVIDASGRRSKAPEWLQRLGLEKPPETKVEAYWGYASRYYERPKNKDIDWTILSIHPTPPDSTRIGVIVTLEKNIWHVLLCGNNKDYPPDDHEGYLEFARGLPSSEFYDAIKDAKPISGIYGYRFADNCRRHYESLPRYLEGFLVLGDAACQFNPIYAQGMSVAALGAARLDRCMASFSRRRLPDGSMPGLARAFQKSLARDIWPVWLVTTTEDLRVARDTAPGKNNLITRLLQAYVKNVIELGAKDVLAYRLFTSVLHLIASPFRLFHPLLVLKVLLHLLLKPRPVPAALPAAAQAQAAAPSSVSPWTSGEAWTPVSGAVIPPRPPLSGPITPPTGVVPPAPFKDVSK